MTDNKGFKLTYSGELTGKYISALLISIAKQLRVDNANELPQILLNNLIYRQFLTKQIYITNLKDHLFNQLGVKIAIKNIDNNTKDLYLIVTDVTRFRDNISFYLLDTFTTKELVDHLELTEKRLSLKERIEKHKISIRAEIEELRTKN
ncbi:hypothetical protein [Streptococcus sp. SP8]|uniref:hypothetical protein n=1 Tax=Streptococcus sp. SP8 TaxID=3018252 RepID=UPI00263E940C|nr:hypothetical protein [Streptococcus sp. SP8]MDN5031784.1 hypothetical protein [Streptococcus sp. SP8]